MRNLPDRISSPRRTRRVLKADEVAGAVTRSGSVYEAARILGVRDPAVYRAMQRFGIKHPQIWRDRRRELSAKLRRKHLASIVTSEPNRLYAGTLVATEGSITSGYDSDIKSTRLKIIIGMTDRPYVVKFAEVCGVGPPREIPPRYKRRRIVWEKTVSGLRAILLLNDIMPYLMGEKRKEAQRALEFFSPTGYTKGKFRAAEIWPPSQFPLKDSFASPLVRSTLQDLEASS